MLLHYSETGPETVVFASTVLYTVDFKDLVDLAVLKCTSNRSAGSPCLDFSFTLLHMLWSDSLMLLNFDPICNHEDVNILSEQVQEKK